MPIRQISVTLPDRGTDDHVAGNLLVYDRISFQEVATDLTELFKILQRHAGAGTRDEAEVVIYPAAMCIIQGWWTGTRAVIRQSLKNALDMLPD